MSGRESGRRRPWPWTETPVAFFQCASNIAAFDVAGANVAVGCAGGQVLQLRAAVLLT